MELWRRLGAEISALMTARGWTVNSLAQKADVDNGTVLDFLEGKFGTVRAAEQICQAFGGLGLIDVIATVLAKEKVEHPPNPLQHWVLRQFESATPEAQHAIEQVLRLVPQQTAATTLISPSGPPRTRRGIIPTTPVLKKRAVPPDQKKNDEQS
jgi:transcriptional regulator with XRE-family HTH domain